MYVKNKHIGESGRLLSNVIEIAKVKIVEVFFVAMGIKKEFDLSDQNFLVFTLEKYSFGKTFLL